MVKDRVAWGYVIPRRWSARQVAAADSAYPLAWSETRLLPPWRWRISALWEVRAQSSRLCGLAVLTKGVWASLPDESFLDADMAVGVQLLFPESLRGRWLPTLRG